MPPFLTPDVAAYNRLMADSFRTFTGQWILGEDDSSLSDADLAQAMFDAPQAIISHGTEPDPIFRYANARTLALWEMDWNTFTRLPSRLSAEAAGDIQSDRNALLAAALARGWVGDYSGTRISRSGRRFDIRDTTLWNVIDAQTNRHGQAAFIRDWRYL